LLIHERVFEQGNYFPVLSIGASNPAARRCDMPAARILCVDDDLQITEMLPKILTLHGYEVVTANTVAAAVTLITSQQFDVLIADLNMGHVADGFTVIHTLELTVSKELLFGLAALLILLNTYSVSRHIELRRVRRQLIGETLQCEMARLQSFIDPLTEIYNRRSLDEMTRQFISRARRHRENLTLMLADVDHFKQVNTKFGHLTGDVILAEVAGLLKSSTRGSDAVVRYGGDEFLVLLANSSAEGARTIIERIEASLDQWNRAGHVQGFKLSFSIGVAEWSERKTLDDLLDEADRDMYAVKNDKSGNHKHRIETACSTFGTELQ
jgi:diguanylate cyclase (GGDEF)-like protein